MTERTTEKVGRWILTVACATIVGLLLGYTVSECGTPYSWADRIGGVGVVLLFARAGYEWGRHRSKSGSAPGRESADPRS